MSETRPGYVPRKAEVIMAADARVSVLGPRGAFGGAEVPADMFGLVIEDANGEGLLVLGTRNELASYVAEEARYHLLDMATGPAPQLTAEKPEDACDKCPHIQAGHAGPRGMCLVSKPSPCPCVGYRKPWGVAKKEAKP